MAISFRVGRVTNRSREIVRQIESRKRKLLHAFGQDTRDEARRLQTQASGNEISQPGQPAKVHSGEPNLETVLYSVNTAAGTVVAGPILTRSTAAPIGKPLPGLIEHGGRVILRPKRKTTGTQSRKRLLRRRSRVAVYKPRPTIRPAAHFALRQLQRNVRSRGLVG